MKIKQNSSKQPNPQGKGLVPVLQALQPLHQLPAHDRSSKVWLHDYLAGALIVSAKFSFKPIINQTYYLYWHEDEWTLSMISPLEWGVRLQASPVASCVLRDDYSWQLSPHNSVAQNPEVLAALATFQAGFVDFIDTTTPLVDKLPFHQPNLPWYPRLMALGLAKTLQGSLARSGSGNQNGQHLLADVSLSQNILLEQNQI
ncbi:hypothetical protein [uncultured Oceanicoccus sp.]|uniref:hypothetical protein n=1 Tax=uncultured Oceanicoccus sp. TaxID=1706381 RepID=UPI0030DB0F77